MDWKQRNALIIAGVLVVVLAIVSIAGSFWVWQRGGLGMMNRFMMRGFGSMLLVTIFWIVIIVIAVWGVSTLLSRPSEPDSADIRLDSALEILKKRFAQGEIDKEEYEEKKKDLS